MIRTAAWPRVPLALARPSVAGAAAFVALELLLLVLRLPSLFEPRWYGDEGIFAAIAWDLRHGATLYADAWDNKPPLIFHIYAAVQSVAGDGVLPLHAAADVRNPARYYASFLAEFVPGARDEIMRDLAADPPRYVLISDRAYAPFPALERFVARYYTPLRAQNDWRLYVREK